MNIGNRIYSIICMLVLVVGIDLHFDSFKIANDTHLICLLISWVICVLMTMACSLDEIRDTLQKK